MSGPLAGVRVVELAGQGPAPFGCMLLADLGAEVVTVQRVGAPSPDAGAHGRGRRIVEADLKDPAGLAVVLDLVGKSDVLVEGFRPGVTERLGLGPQHCHDRNPGLVYARMTGWGQDGPLAETAGHDINYLALSGGLSLIGPRDGAPVPPLNLVSDYGAGGMLLAYGVTAALVERSRTGVGRVVDVAMVDGLAAMLAPFHAASAKGSWVGRRGENFLDGGAPFYGVYETADGGHMAVGAIEPPFYASLLSVLGVDPDELGHQLDRAAWPAARDRIATAFATRTREEWTALFDGTDACVTPVLDLAEARAHPHAVARTTFRDSSGVPHQAPAPRFSEVAR